MRRDVAERHQRDRRGPHTRGLNHEALMTADARVARQWLSARVAFAVHVPEVSGTVLERVEICLLDGQRACLIRYRAGTMMRYEWLTLPGGVWGLAAAYAAYLSHRRRCSTAGCRFVGERTTQAALGLATLVVIIAVLLRVFPSWTATLLQHQH
jgi:hypothetical protein